MMVAERRPRIPIKKVTVRIYPGRDDDLFYPRSERVSLPEEIVKALRAAADGRRDNRNLVYPEPDRDRASHRTLQIHLQLFEGDEKVIELLNSLDDYRKNEIIKNIYRYYRESPPLCGFTATDGYGFRRVIPEETSSYQRPKEEVSLAADDEFGGLEH